MQLGAREMMLLRPAVRNRPRARARLRPTPGSTACLEAPCTAVLGVSAMPRGRVLAGRRGAHEMNNNTGATRLY